MNNNFNDNPYVKDKLYKLLKALALLCCFLITTDKFTYDMLIISINAIITC